MPTQLQSVYAILDFSAFPHVSSIGFRIAAFIIVPHFSFRYDLTRTSSLRAEPHGNYSGHGTLRGNDTR